MLANDVLQFWFQGVTDRNTANKKELPYSLWFRSTPAFDHEIREKFSHYIGKAAAGDLDDWKETPAGTLALIILLDQFPRNIGRGTPQAYQHDQIAQQLAFELICNYDDRELQLIERLFVYMPLMHAEDRATQAESVIQFEQLVEDSKSACPQNTPYYEYHLKYARQYHDTILKHGFFPQRS